MLRLFNIALLVSLAAVAAPALAAAPLPPVVCQRLTNCQLIGKGMLTWWGLRVYEASLWGPKELRQQPSSYTLAIRYLRHIKGEQLTNTSIDQMQRMGMRDAATLSRWRVAMLKLFPDVAPEDRLIGVHHPQQGAIFYLGDRYLGVVEDVEFARYFFAIWLGERAYSSQLRDELLNTHATHH